MPPTGASFEGLAYRGYTSDEVASPPKYNFRQNAESVGLDPGANTVHLICRPPGILYAGRRIPQQFQLKDGWACAGDTQVPLTDNGVGRLLAADEDE
jgi:hypothetical protein